MVYIEHHMRHNDEEQERSYTVKKYPDDLYHFQAK